MTRIPCKSAAEVLMCVAVMSFMLTVHSAQAASDFSEPAAEDFAKPRKFTNFAGDMSKALFSLNLRGRLVEFTRPVVMGILNITPDSFFSGSRVAAEDAARKAGLMLNEGAEIIDIGGCSTRPGSESASAEEEWLRLAPALEEVRSRHPDAIISVDTFRSEIARKSAERFGVDIINDIGGARLDEEMLAAVAELKVGYVAMHSRGIPASMAQLTDYEDVVADVLGELARLVSKAHSLGISDVIADPGFGFAKTAEQNFRLLSELEIFKALRCPLLVGVSRKGMIWRSLDVRPEEALNGTTVVNTLALARGASILRVHDVRAAVEAVKLVGMLPQKRNFHPTI